MLKYLEDKYGDKATRGSKASLSNMRNEVQRLEAQLAAQKEKTAGSSNEKPEDRNSEDETDEDDVSIG